MKTRAQARKRRLDEEPRYVVGMDAHSRKLALSVWDWSDRFNPVLIREFKCVDIDAMVATYRRHVDLDSITVIEASTNSTTLKNRLQDAGFRAGVVRPDLIANKERERKVCDIQDARNLALAYIKGDVDDFVWTPSDKYAEYRDVVLAYRDAQKEMTRCSNRIWSVCSQKGYPLPIRSGTTKPAQIRQMISGMAVGGFVRERLEILIREYEMHLDTKERLKRIMAETVVGNRKMLRLMQLPGFNYRAAFAVESATEDARRFTSASKFKAYSGYAPKLGTSGEEEERAKRKGGPGRPLDGEGRRDLKFFMAEAGQTVLSRCAQSDLGKWGWRLINRGKARNKVVCAIGGKLATYAWHIMRGDKTPNRDGEALFRRKMVEFYSDIGKKRMRELGYGSRQEFASFWVKEFYGHLPQDPPKETASETSC